MGAMSALLAPHPAHAQLLSTASKTTTATGGLLGTGVAVGTTNPGSGVLGTGLTVSTSSSGTGILGTGATVGTTSPGSGVLGSGVTVGTSNPDAGVLGTGATVGTTSPGSGVLGTGVTVGTSNSGSGLLGTGVTAGTTNPGSGILGTGVSVGTAGSGTGVLGTGVTVGTTDPGSGLLGTGLTLGTSAATGSGAPIDTTGASIPVGGLRPTLGPGGNEGTGTSGAPAPAIADYDALALRMSKLEQQVGGAAVDYPLRGTDTSQRGAPVASGADSLAAGYGAKASGASSTAVGTAASAAGDGAVAVGATASAGQTNSVAIGTGARTTRAGQVAIGTDQSTYTMAGLGSAASRAAQSGPTQFVTSDASGNLATSGYGPSSIAALEGRVGTLEASVSQLQRDMRGAYQGTAIALALSGAVLPAGKNFAVSTGFGTYHGETGFGASGVARISDNLYVSGGIGVATSGQSNVAGRGGVTLAW